MITKRRLNAKTAKLLRKLAHLSAANIVERNGGTLEHEVYITNTAVGARPRPVLFTDVDGTQKIRTELPTIRTLSKSSIKGAYRRIKVLYKKNVPVSEVTE